MKKLALTIAIVLGISLCSFAQEENVNVNAFAQEENGGGLFKYGEVKEKEGSSWFNIKSGKALVLPGLPNSFGSTDDEDAPLGSGVAMLFGLGAAYLLAKKRKE